MHKNAVRRSNDNVPCKLYRPGKVAHVLNVHPKTIKRWSDQGLLPYYSVGPHKTRMYSGYDIANFVVLDSDVPRHDSAKMGTGEQR